MDFFRKCNRLQNDVPNPKQKTVRLIHGIRQRPLQSSSVVATLLNESLPFLCLIYEALTGSSRSISQLAQEYDHHHPAMPEDVKIGVRDLDRVVFKDDGSKIKDSGKWPLLIDTVGVVSTFLRHRDTNYIEALNPGNMKPPALRMSLLGALRYGKPLVLDIQDADMFDQCTRMFDEIQPGLMKAILDKSILKESVYEKLITDADLPEYDKLKFKPDEFVFIVLTLLSSPKDIMAHTYHIIVE